MLCYNYLKAWNVFLREFQQYIEQPTHRNEICISLRLLYRAVGIFVNLLRQKYIRVGWSITRKRGIGQLF